MQKILLSVVTAFFFAGCIVERKSTGRPLDFAAVARLERGVTTMMDAIGLLGVPQEVNGPDARVAGPQYTFFTYAYADESMEADFVPAGPINLVIHGFVKRQVESWPPLGSTPLAEWIKSSKHYQLVVLGFDGKGYLRYVAEHNSIPPETVLAPR